MHFTRRQSMLLMAAGFAPALPRRAFAQDWPTRAIRVVVPFTAGSTVDVIARIVLDQLAIGLGQTITVENRGGAGGSIGAASVAKADPDGYTILVNSSAHSAAPALYPNAPYNAVSDFAAVIPFGNTPNVTVISPDKGIRSLRQLVAAAKAKPGAISFATAGVGSASHLTAERLRLSAGFEATHVPFRGGPEALTEVMTGRVDFFCPGVTSPLPFIREGKLLALSVSTLKRSAILPDVPTTREQGFADAEYNFWTGMLLPAQTPREIVAKLYRESTRALQAPGVREKLAQQGAEPMPMTSAEFDALIKEEVAINIALVKAAGIATN